MGVAFWSTGSVFTCFLLSASVFGFSSDGASLKFRGGAHRAACLWVSSAGIGMVHAFSMEVRPAWGPTEFDSIS